MNSTRLSRQSLCRLRRAVTLSISLSLLVAGSLTSQAFAATAEPEVAHWGYINPTGKLVIEPKYPMVCQFSNNRAAVLTGDGFGSDSLRVKADIYEARGGQWSYIDKSGKMVIDSSFDGAGLFNQELAPVAVGFKQGVSQPDRWGFINSAGKLAIKPQFNAVHALSEDSVAVQFGTWKNIGEGMRSWVVGKWGFINKSGKTVIKPEYTGIGEFHEQLAPVLVPPKAL
ncbi:hypothetical protein BH11CYA1_BH11CYA1_03140 [soil metagenome]